MISCRGAVSFLVCLGEKNLVSRMKSVSFKGHILCSLKYFARMTSRGTKGALYAFLLSWFQLIPANQGCFLTSRMD